MGKKSSAYYQTLLTIGVIAILSYLVLRVTNQGFSPEMGLNVDAGEIGQAVLDKLVDIVLSLINPERRSF